MRMLITLSGLLLFTSACTEPGSIKETNYANCLECHKGIESISDNHYFQCASCHITPEARSIEKITSHNKIIRNPSDPSHVSTFCLSCHEKEIKQVENSLHASMAGIINQTRYLWGAQKSATPAVYGLSGPLQPLPGPDLMVYPETPEMLADDFLRRRCLRCHIHTPGAEGRGLYRSTGCAACHVLYEDDGRYRGNDEAIDRSAKGYPSKHEFSKLIPNTQCLHCHNHNHVGADYEGLFEHDYSSTYRSPNKDDKPVTMIYGIEHHCLAKDIHSEKGLWCIDCHTKQDVMGDGRLYSFEMEVPKRTCSDCHGDFNNSIPDLSIEAIRKVTHHVAANSNPLPLAGEGTGDEQILCQEKSKFLFVSKNNGRSYPLSLFSNDSVGHNVQAHKRVRCSACHAQWSYQDYGLSIIREDLMEGYKWYHLTAQGDPSLQEILKKHLDKPGWGDPISRDWLSGEAKLGIWSAGWRFRRWEYMPLGVDYRNRYAIVRPLYQYLISYVDRLGNVPLDSVIPSRGDGTGEGWAFMPYVPHTIAPFGRRCESCHLNRVAAGLGMQEEMTIDTRLTIPSPPAINTMRLLNHEERNKLLEPSNRWQKERFRAVANTGFTRKR